MPVDTAPDLADAAISIRGVTQRYIHIDEALRMTADRVAGEMADLLDGRAPPTRKRAARDSKAESHPAVVDA